MAYRWQIDQLKISTAYKSNSGSFTLDNDPSSTFYMERLSSQVVDIVLFRSENKASLNLKVKFWIEVGVYGRKVNKVNEQIGEFCRFNDLGHF